MVYEKKKVVILGGGYAGLMTAVSLQKKVHPSRIDVYLVNKNDYHYFTTKVHEMGAGTVNPESIRLPIRDLIDPHFVTFIQDEVINLNLERKIVECKDHTLPYDYVVFGIGGAPKNNEIHGLTEHGFFLFDWEGSYRLREHIEKQFLEYGQNPSGPLNLVIGGTGFTGMEFIHELKERIPRLCNLYGVEREDVHILIIEPGKKILQGYPEAIVADTTKSLKKINCEFLVGVSVSQVECDQIRLADGRVIPTKTFVWAGGVQGNPILQIEEFERMDARVRLNEFCEVPNYPDVYVLGDASVSFNEKGEPYPPTAQIAIQQGQYCAYNIAMKIYGQPAKPFHYIYRGMVMSLGSKNASGIVYHHHINGRLGSFMKWLIEMRYYFMLGGLRLVRKEWKSAE
ncbi:NAD(P)/FAD-dependent oxidoreductase [Bacillus sp. ISL-18]|uniref:NAD(P)/FAD-dependent oxidoreductase n=1 Tax=Bacillus sp. ISL-18 TaxID=2819118 RepID=UPI001BE73F12|nr:NAD(P)/FAD-dependent oxidoreductase [Bacillus sp. ISL-18]MBT2655717.1 NAD(P)/FAD-dependent oxidoreductase [Bacillus sp. ISL-18]